MLIDFIGMMLLLLGWGAVGVIIGALLISVYIIFIKGDDLNVR